MSACSVHSIGQQKAKAYGLRHRADATCMELSCVWQKLGRWSEATHRATVEVARAARTHTASTGHETMVDTVTRRTYLHKQATP